VGVWATEEFDVATRQLLIRVTLLESAITWTIFLPAADVPGDT
jgi:hypothetical protein